MDAIINFDKPIRGVTSGGNVPYELVRKLEGTEFCFVIRLSDSRQKTIRQVNQYGRDAGGRKWVANVGMPSVIRADKAPDESTMLYLISKLEERVNTQAQTISDLRRMYTDLKAYVDSYNSIPRVMRGGERGLST